MNSNCVKACQKNRVEGGDKLEIRIVLSYGCPIKLGDRKVLNSLLASVWYDENPFKCVCRQAARAEVSYVNKACAWESVLCGITVWRGLS